METIVPARESLHGQWSSGLEPTVRVEPGERVTWEDVLDVSWGRGQHDREAQWRDKWPDRESPRDDGPALHGPVFVEGATPGSTLAVTIEEHVLGGYGWTIGGAGPFNQALNDAVGVPPDERLMLWSIDDDARTATSEHGVVLPIRPFFGCFGVCPDGDGWHSGWYPTRHGGNMDLPPMTVGSTVYLPVAHEGGLFSLGDTHARQGDGELSGSAIECMTKSATLRFDIANFEVATVTADTPTGWVTAGFDRDIDAAICQAVSGMLDLMERLLGVDRTDAMLLASSVVDVRVTQLVNGVRGAHAVLSPEVFGG